MIVDLRTYTMIPGRLNAWLKLYETDGYPIHVRHLGEPLGWRRDDLCERAELGDQRLGERLHVALSPRAEQHELQEFVIRKLTPNLSHQQQTNTP